MTTLISRDSKDFWIARVCYVNMRQLLIVAVIFAICPPSVHALLITFEDGTSVNSFEYSLRGLIKLSKALGNSDPRASRKILEAIGMKQFRKSHHAIDLDRPVRVGSKEVWYVRPTKTSRTRLVEITAALIAQNPQDIDAIGRLTVLLVTEPITKRAKVDLESP